jgi:hypothetical protein
MRESLKRTSAFTAMCLTTCGCKRDVAKLISAKAVVVDRSPCTANSSTLTATYSLSNIPANAHTSQYKTRDKAASIRYAAVYRTENIT